MRRGGAPTMETQTQTVKTVLIHCPTCYRPVACRCAADAEAAIARHIFVEHLVAAGRVQ